MKQVRVLFFATFRDLTGLRQTSFELSEDTHVSDLRLQLGEAFPNLASQIKSALVAINTEYAFDEDLIPDKAEIAIFPPVSGGSVDNHLDIIAITESELDLDDLLSRITFHSTGAACMFAGMVRGKTTRAEPHETVYLEYEAYEPMAEQKMHQVAGEIRERWPAVEGIVIVQRIGRLYPRTPTVLIACTAAHRDTGVFEAARYGIDRLKEIVPIWKKEVGSRGEEWVEGEYIPGRND
jgi:molybdopterin converting factor subunit 1